MNHNQSHLKAAPVRCDHRLRSLALAQDGRMPRSLLACACDDCAQVLREHGWDLYAPVASR
jgi:hypothetical protein